MLNLPVPEKAGSGTDHEDLDELESGLRLEDKHIRDARYGPVVKLRVLSHVLVNSWKSLRNVKRGPNPELGSVMGEGQGKIR